MLAEVEATVVTWFIMIGITFVVLLISQIIIAIFLWRTQNKYQNLMATVARTNCYLADLRKLGILPSEPLQQHEGISMGFTVMSNVGDAVHNSKAQTSVKGGTPVPGAEGGLLNG